MGKYFLTGLCIIIFSAIYSQAHDPKAELWADSVLTTMSLEDKVGQLFFIVTPAVDDLKSQNKLGHSLSNYKAGGILFKKGGAPLTRVFIEKLNTYSRLPLAVGGGIMHAGHSLPNPSITAPVTERAILDQYRQEFYVGIEEIGLNFILDSAIYQFPRLFDFETSPGIRGDNTIIPLFSTWENQPIQKKESYKGVLVTLDSVYRRDKKIQFNKTTAGMLRLSGFEGLILTNIDQHVEGLEDIHPAELAFLSGTDILLAEGDLHPAIEALTKGLKKKKLLMTDLNNKCRRILTWKYQSLYPDRKIY
ncbi:MAG: hypothetical protein OEY51_12620, partial [Cyclobacteriaceae bacterium]|nr:hypothetical protein [Cyclobacteriaceae bacterium]